MLKRVWRKGNLLTLLVGIKIGAATMGNSIEVPQKTTNGVTYDPAIPLPDKTIIQKDTCTPMCTAALLRIAKTWRQPKCQSTDGWINKMLQTCIPWTTSQT